MSTNLFLLWTFILFGRPQDFFSFLIPLRIALLMTVLIVAVTVFNNRINFIQNVVRLPQAKRYLIIYVIMILGIPLSIHRGQSFDFVIMQYSLQLIYFILFVIYIDSIEKLEKVFSVICLASFFYVCFGLINSGSLFGRFAYGTAYDPNDLAAFLVAIFPMNLYFLSGNRGVLKKIIAIAAIGVSIVVILMTGSRGGFIGLIMVMFFLFFTKLGPFKLFQKVALLVTLLIILGANYEKIDIERYRSLTDLESDYNVSSEEGRLGIWKRGIELTLINPVTGVGPNCFGMALGYYREKMGEIPKWQTAHNSYLQFLTEIGVIGFFVYVLMIFSSMKIFFNCTKEETLPEQLKSVSKMCKVLLLAFVGYLTCAFFLSHAYSIVFTLFFSFSVTIQKLYGDSKKLPTTF